MSRITLSKWDNGEARLVVGWDHPAGGAFWTEFNRETGEDGKPLWEDNEDWQEVLRNGGMFPGIAISDLREAMPEDLRSLVTDRVIELLAEHSLDPDSGYGARAQILDLT